jgi:hypothetical protein
MLRQVISEFSPEKASTYFTLETLPETLDVLLAMKPCRRAQILNSLSEELQTHLLEKVGDRASELEYDMKQIKSFDEEQDVSGARPRELTEKEEQTLKSMNWSQVSKLCTILEKLSGNFKDLKLLSDGFDEIARSQKDITTNENIVEHDEDGRTQSSEELHGDTNGKVQTQDKEEKAPVQNVTNEEVRDAGISKRVRRRRGVDP